MPVSAVSLCLCPENHGNCESKWPSHSQSRRWNRRPSRWLGIRPTGVQRTVRACSTNDPRFRFDSAGSSCQHRFALTDRVIPLSAFQLSISLCSIFLWAPNSLFRWRAISCSFVDRNMEKSVKFRWWFGFFFGANSACYSVLWYGVLDRRVFLCWVLCDSKGLQPERNLTNES